MIGVVACHPTKTETAAGSQKEDHAMTNVLLYIGTTA